MNEYGNQESWTKKFVFHHHFINIITSCYSIDQIKYIKNGEILMLRENNTVICYNPIVREVADISNFLRVRL